MLVRSERRYRFDVGPEAVWEALTHLEHYQVWWPWLREFDASCVEAGARWSCVVQPPLPYLVRFDLVLTDVVPASSASARVEGDINGTARLELHANGDRTDLDLVSDLAPAGRALRAFALLARPAVRWGHDWVLDTGFRQFAEHAIDVDVDPERRR